MTNHRLTRAGGLLAIVGVIAAMAAGLLFGIPHFAPVSPSMAVGFGVFLAFAAAQVTAGMLLVFERDAAWPVGTLAAAGVTVGIGSFDSHSFAPVTAILVVGQVVAIALVMYAAPPMPSLSRLAMWSVLPLAPIGFALFLLATTPPPVSRVPDAVGVVHSVRPAAEADVFTLEDGAMVEINRSEAERLFELRPDEGLLLYGAGEEEPWYAIVGTYRSDEECFELEDTATDMDTHILFDSGLLLPKAPDFRRYDNFHDDRYEERAQIGFTPFRLNERGEVTDYLSVSNPRS